MQWISNAKYGQELTDSGIFDLKGYEVKVTIHKIHGLGDDLFLSSPDFGFNQCDLHTNNFDEAVEKAKSLILERANFLSNEALKFYDDKSDNEFVRY